jgi:hypothetical protein
VGICLRALGVPDQQLLSEPTAGSAGAWTLHQLLERTWIYSNNDHFGSSEEVREANITEDFAKAGITVTFTD